MKGPGGQEHVPHVMRGARTVTSPWSSREVQLRPLMEIAEHSLTVLQLAELDVKRADPAWQANYALQWMEQSGYDAAPVDDAEPHRFIDRAWLKPDDHPIVRQARPIDATLLVSSDLGLADGVSRLMSRPFYFVLHRDNLRGIVTRADLQRPAVGMVLFGMILASETAANVIIDHCLGPSWIDHLSVERGTRIRKIFDDRLRTNTEVTMLECLMLRDRLNLLRECGSSVISRLGFASDEQFTTWMKSLIRLRNYLAHGGTLLHAQSDPIHAIELFESVRAFPQKIWELT
jgi:hypothetical protein